MEEIALLETGAPRRPPGQPLPYPGAPADEPRLAYPPSVHPSPVPDENAPDTGGVRCAGEDLNLHGL